MKYPGPADIAKMRAKGYDASTIAEAERQSQRWEAARQVIAAVGRAFTGVQLGSGTGLMEALGLGDYADAETLAAYRLRDEKKDRRRIASEGLQGATAASVSSMPRECGFACPLT